MSVKILLIEDDYLKLKAIKDFLKTFPKMEVVEKMSYQAGILSLLRDNFDLVLLDMQLPNYDIKSGEDGYRLRPMAGRDILREIKRKKLNAQVIIVTQYEGFGEKGKYASLDQWHRVLKEEFGNIYKFIVFYKPGLNSWKDKLKPYLNQRLST